MLCRDGKCITESENLAMNHTQVTTNVTDQSNDVVSPAEVSCSDTTESFSGLSCAELLKLYAYRYCDYSYIKKNCCVSYGIFCDNKI